MKNPIFMLSVICFALAIHFFSQKQLFKAGLKAENAKPQTTRLMINGTMLIALGVLAASTYGFPFGLAGILLFIEGAICYGFAKKLRHK